MQNNTFMFALTKKEKDYGQQRNGYNQEPRC